MICVGKSILYILMFGAIVGCGSPVPAKVGPVEPNAKPPQSGDPALTILSGPQGSISLDDTMDRAKKVFAVPQGATATSQPELTLTGESHFGWESRDVVFDAFATNGRLTTISILLKNLAAPERQTEIDRELERFDEPTENAEGQTTAAYVWREDGAARIVVEFFAKETAGILRVVGTTDALEDRGFPIGKLSELVSAFDEGAFQ
ncbi:MAG: hypothetical protein M3R13_06325 [Armatimonadota bacterium]|nr:hypothetical protein [Armatimonadota bacterium]